MIPNYQNPPLVGITSASLIERNSEQAKYDPFGIYTLLYSHDPAKGMFASRWDKAGNLIGFVRLRPLDPWKWLPMPGGHHAPNFGEPYENAVVLDPEKPDEIVVGPWDKVANLITGKDYTTVREGMFARHLSGYHLGKFIGDAKGFANNGGSGFNVQAAQSKISQLALLRKALFDRHPEWQAQHGVEWKDANPGSSLGGMAN